MGRGTFSSGALAAALDAFESFGLDRAAACRDIGLDAATLADPEARIPIARAVRLFDEAPARTGIEHAGLAAASRMPMGALDIMDLLARASPTVFEAAARVQRYYSLIDDQTSLVIGEEDGALRIVLRDRSEFPPARAARELLMAVLVLRLRELTGLELPLRLVQFVFSKPADASPHHELFRVPVQFDQPEDALVLDASLLAAPILTSDPIILPYLDRRAQMLHARLPRPDDWLDTVRSAVRHSLSSGSVELGDVAHRMGTSARTLQRRLRKADTSHQQIVDAVRRELGVRWLLDDVPIGEIFERLGFSDGSAFHRAFKRWTGHTPSDYRERIRHSPTVG